MQLGDLVELSCYGSKLKLLRYQRDLVGMVVEVTSGQIWVEWYGRDPKKVSARDRLTRKDLRHVR